MQDNQMWIVIRRNVQDSDGVEDVELTAVALKDILTISRSGDMCEVEFGNDGYLTLYLCGSDFEDIVSQGTFMQCQSYIKNKENFK